MPSTSNDEIAEVEKAKDDIFVILSYLWLIAKDLGKVVTLTDVGDTDDALDSKCNNIRVKFNEDGGTPSATLAGAGPTRTYQCQS